MTTKGTRLNIRATELMHSECSHLLDEDVTNETLETIADHVMHKMDPCVHVTELQTTVDACHTSTVEEDLYEDNLFGLAPIETNWYSGRRLVIRVNMIGMPIAIWFTVKGA